MFPAGEHVWVWERSLFTLSNGSSALDSVIVTLPHSTIIIWVPLPLVFLSLIRTTLRSSPDILLIFQLSVSSWGAFQLCAVTAEHDGKMCLSNPWHCADPKEKKRNCLKSFTFILGKHTRKKQKKNFLLPWSIFACQIQKQERTWFVSKYWNTTQVLTVIITISHWVFIWVLLCSGFSAKPWYMWMLKRGGHAAFVEIFCSRLPCQKRMPYYRKLLWLGKEEKDFSYVSFIYSFVECFKGIYCVQKLLPGLLPNSALAHLSKWTNNSTGRGFDWPWMNAGERHGVEC